MNPAQLSLAILIGLMIGAQTAPAARPVPPTRDPNTPGYVTARELPDGALPPADADGNFIIGPTHNPAPAMAVQDGVPQGTVYNFTMSSADSQTYPGIARAAGTFGTVDPADPAKLVVTTSHPATYTRRVAVYVPKQYVPGSVAPLIVGADGPDPALFTALDNLIAQKRVPVMIAISIGNGSGDAQGSQRGLEYDTMSGRYAEFVETEVLPLVEKQYNVKLTRDPEARATMGGSSGGSAALIMAWYHPELYHRVLTYSLTAVNQQWPPSAETPHGAWEFHERLIPNSPAKPIRIWMEVGDRDLLNPNVMRDNMHDWVVANENMARVLAARGYHYQFVFARNAGHTDRTVKQQTLPEALEWLWKAAPPQAAISNSRVHAQLYLPDAQSGYYQGTRFDWSGVISNLEWNGHSYFGQWFQKYDPKLHDAIMGPVEEFNGLGYDEAKAGESFVRIGVGALRKPIEPAYRRFGTYDIVDPGTWTVHRSPDRVELIHTLRDTAGYAYEYRKVVRLKGNTLVLEHRLKNTGRKPIATSVYNHDFFMLDSQPTGPDFVVRFPFEITAVAPLNGAAEIRGKDFVYLRELQAGESLQTQLTGFGPTARDYDIRLENRKTGAGVRQIGDRPMSRINLWSPRTTICPEAYIDLTVAPGQTSSWQITYEFYQVPRAK